MPDCIRMRFDEDLLGRIMACKMRGEDGLSMNSDIKINVLRTIQPEVKFESFNDWRESIRKDYLLTQEIKQNNKQAKEIMSNNLEFHSDWLNAKFKIQ